MSNGVTLTGIAARVWEEFCGLTVNLYGVPARIGDYVELASYQNIDKDDLNKVAIFFLQKNIGLQYAVDNMFETYISPYGYTFFLQQTEENLVLRVKKLSNEKEMPANPVAAIRPRIVSHDNMVFATPPDDFANLPTDSKYVELKGLSDKAKDDSPIISTEPEKLPDPPQKIEAAMNKKVKV